MRIGRQYGAAFAVNLAMSNELTVQAVGAVPATSEAVVKPKHVPVARVPASATSATPMPNPYLRLNAALGLVVIEFRDNSGDAVTTSIPSQRQLEAYQRWDVTHFGPTPSGFGAKSPRTEGRPSSRATQEVQEPQPEKPQARGLRQEWH